MMRLGPTVEKPAGGGDGGILGERHQFSSLASYLRLTSPPLPPISIHGIIIRIENEKTAIVPTWARQSKILQELDEFSTQEE